MTSRSWWQSAVVYQVYPRSFADSDGDGMGDLEGIRRHLDHLEWLGVDAIWISPFFRSPMRDAGYDVADHCDVDRHLGAASAWPTWVLSNHDNSRHRTRYGNSARRARAAAVLLLTLRGTPVLYQGEELGLADIELTPGEQVDPGGRDGARAPIPWTAEPPHGWDGAATWLPFPPDASDHSVERQRADQSSMLHLYRRLLATRRASPALQSGSWSALPGPPDVIAYRRQLADDCRVVLINFGEDSRTVAVDGAWQIELSSSSDDVGGRFAGDIAGETAVVLQPSAHVRA